MRTIGMDLVIISMQVFCYICYFLTIYLQITTGLFVTITHNYFTKESCDSNGLCTCKLESFLSKVVEKSNFHGIAASVVVHGRILSLLIQDNWIEEPLGKANEGIDIK